MNTFLLLIFTCSISLYAIFGFQHDQTEIQSYVGEVVVDELTVEEVLIQLGEKKAPHYIEKIDQAKVEIGRQLLFKGKAKTANKSGRNVSGFFKCTDCHTFESEFERPNELDPQARLEYAKTKNLPFLPGSTLWGIYNRKHWYNGDYVKKYGDLVTNARDTLPNAIQVCAKYCSSGRFLKNWEVEGIMHYFKQHELKIKDIQLDPTSKKMIGSISNLGEDEQQQLIATINGAFTTAFPATFPGALDPNKRGYGKTGNAKNGEVLFDKACLFCHQNGRVAYLELAKDDITANMFLNHLKGYTDLSLYQILRWGTHPKDGRKQYMPMYTKEKMSDQQIEDIIAYLRTLTKKNS